MIITFIGNCQTLALCFYFQELLNDTENIRWVLYGDEFTRHVYGYAFRCKNLIGDGETIINQLQKSDVIIYQEIVKEKSLFSNQHTLEIISKKGCKLIKIPSVYLDYQNCESSIKELQLREEKNNVDIKVSLILQKYLDKNPMLSEDHPTTQIFMDMIKEICAILNIDFF